MISERLEKLILSGKANYRMYTHAATGKSIILVPDQRFVVITDIWIYDFLDHDLEGTPAIIRSALERAVKQISIYSDDSTTRFLHRSNMGYSPDQTDTRGILTTNGVTNYSVYLPHKSNITIELLNVPDPSTWFATGFAPSATRSQSRSLPSGYSKIGLVAGGVTLSSTNRVRFTAVEETRQDPITAPSTPAQSFSAEGFQVPANAANLLDAPTQQIQSLQYPIINIGYVEIFENPINVQGGN